MVPNSVEDVELDLPAVKIRVGRRSFSGHCGEGFDTGPLEVRERVPDVLWVFAALTVFLGLPAGFPTLPVLF